MIYIVYFNDIHKLAVKCMYNNHVTYFLMVYIYTGLQDFFHAMNNVQSYSATAVELYKRYMPTRGSSFFLGKVTALGVLCCFALFVCLTLLASFFLPSHLSFKNMYTSCS